MEIGGKSLPPQSMSITFIKEKASVHSGLPSVVKLGSVSQCKELSATDDPELMNNNRYNPCLYGFRVSNLSIGKKELIDVVYFDSETDGRLSFETNCLFPSAPERVEGIIIHQPNEVWGYDGTTFLIEIVTGYHGESITQTQFDWVKDGTVVSSGSSCLYVVKDPGTYHCRVTHGNFTDTSRNIKIVTVAAVESAATSSHKSAPPEVTIDDLQIDHLRPLGTGSFGTVYRGKWLGCDVAVKAIKLPKRVNQSAQVMRMVESEPNINAKIRHPNLVQFLGVSKEPDMIYLVSEFLDGANMEDVIFDDATKQRMGLKKADKVNVARMSAQGLAYLVHNLVPPIIDIDIKPANILIRYGCFTTKICDLGLSKMKSLTAATTTMTGVGAGSPAYMAPECLLLNAKATFNSDVWAIGVTMTELFTEEDAWSADGEIDPL
ncbi:probable serine/threonine-protein kinase DDB_G0267514 [Lineus longissimus]|uniref:probable serine/threonine-protein kinase DDB_G0267514 n=1 Tax=Lineus longissimus TaxID=88925 RepID=UPI00315DBC1E